MAGEIENKKSKGPIVDPALCRCCRQIKKCRLLTADYEWRGQTENYAHLILDCFGLVLSHLDGSDHERGVCATCVSRLRDAYAFRSQVLQAEELFWQAHTEIKDKDIEVEVKMVKEEKVIDVKEGSPVPSGSSYEPVIETIDNGTDTKNNAEIIKDGGSIDLNKKRKGVKRKKVMKKRKLLNEMKALEFKLNNKIKETRHKLKLENEKPNKLDAEQMSYDNLLTLIENSYICPFSTRVSMYYCFYCKDQFTDPTELRDHTLNHDVNEFKNVLEKRKLPKIDITKIDCRLCTEKIDSIPSLKEHLTKKHNKIIHNTLIEVLCFKLTLNDLACLECDQKFPFFDELKNHMNQHFGKHVCDMCGACFFEPTSLCTHIRAHSKKEINYPCHFCGKNLKSKYSRQMHIITIHEKRATVNCYKCDAVFMTHALRNKHLIDVHDDKRTFPCLRCDKVYKIRKTMVEHVRRNHSKVYKHECSVCGQRFFLPSRLREHEAAHTGRFRCELCDATYTKLHALQEHVRTHTNDNRLRAATFAPSQ